MRRPAEGSVVAADPTELPRRALRSGVCRVCSQRPLASEGLSPLEPRSCEPGCVLFRRLPSLLALAARAGGAEACGAAEAAVRESICHRCTDAETAGEFCAEALARTCPVSRYAALAVAVLERLPGGAGREVA